MLAGLGASLALSLSRPHFRSSSVCKPLFDTSPCRPPETGTTGKVAPRGGLSIIPRDCYLGPSVERHWRGSLLSEYHGDSGNTC